MQFFVMLVCWHFGDYARRIGRWNCVIQNGIKHMIYAYGYEWHSFSLVGTKTKIFLSHDYSYETPLQLQQIISWDGCLVTPVDHTKGGVCVKAYEGDE